MIYPRITLQASRGSVPGKLCRTLTAETDVMSVDAGVDANAVAYSPVTKVCGGICCRSGPLESFRAMHDVLALVGPNGAGNTMTFNIIHTFTTR